MVNRIHIIIVAAGTGSRFGSAVPKQFCDLSGRPVLVHAWQRLAAHYPGAGFTVVCSPLWADTVAAYAERYGLERPRLVAGGATRWESVRNGLATVPQEADIILVHDGARPNPSEALLTALDDALAAGAAGAIPATAVTDSLRALEPDGTSRPVDRASLRAVQTPQAFRADVLRRAYALPYRPEFTDDASVVEAAGAGAVMLTRGEPSNIKITNPADIVLAEILIRNAHSADRP